MPASRLHVRLTTSPGAKVRLSGEVRATVVRRESVDLVDDDRREPVEESAGIRALADHHDLEAEGYEQTVFVPQEDS